MRGILSSIRVFFLLLVATTIHATTYYVATPANGGNNANPGTIAQPFATIQHGADVAVASDIIIVTPGTYAGAFIDHSGNPGSPITIQGQAGAIVTSPGVGGFTTDNFEIRASYITIENLEIHSAGRAGIGVIGDVDGEALGIVLRNNFCHNNGRWGIFTGYAKDVLIENNETSFSGAEHGIYVSNSSDNPIIRFNVVHHNLSSGIQINADPALDGDGIITNAVIDSNVIYENGQTGGGGAAINLASVRSSLIVNNLLYNNHKGGIAGWDDGFCGCGGNFTFGTRDNKFYNNTVIMPADGRVVVSLLNGSINNEFRNNILIHLGIRPSINTDGTSQPGINSNFNLVKNTFSNDDGDTFITLAAWQALGAGHDQNSIIYNGNAASLFVNAGANDYHIITGSQAQNTGTTVTGVPDDLDEIPRPQGGIFDIGCYEFVQACPGDVTDPTTSITSPSDNDTVGDTINITADADDDCVVTKVEFYLDGNVLLGFDTTDPYSLNWDTRDAADGAHTLTTLAYDPSNNTGASTVIDVTVDNPCIYCDDFENDVIDGWTFIKGTWSEANGKMTGVITKKADIISPSAWGGCSQCTIEADLNTSTGGVVSLLGWYVDKKNWVEIALFEAKNKITLKRKALGKVVAKGKFNTAINPGQDYHVLAEYTGSNLVITLDSAPIFDVPAGAGTPSGIVGFRVKPSPPGTTVTANFEEIVVY